MILSLTVLHFVSTWSEFPIALTLLQENNLLWTVPPGLLSFEGQFADDYQLPALQL